MKLIYVAYGSSLITILGLSFIAMAQTTEILPVEDIYRIAVTKYATSTITAIDQIEQTEIIKNKIDELLVEQKKTNELVGRLVVLYGQ